MLIRRMTLVPRTRDAHVHMTGKLVGQKCQSPACLKRWDPGHPWPWQPWAGLMMGDFARLGNLCFAAKVRDEKLRADIAARPCAEHLACCSSPNAVDTMFHPCCRERSSSMRPSGLGTMLVRTEQSCKMHSMPWVQMRLLPQSRDFKTPRGEKFPRLCRRGP